MALQLRHRPLDGALPTLRFTWDRETEILAGRFPPSGEDRGLTGSVEFEGPDGTFLLMEVELGTVCGLEVVVWPDVVVAPELTPPAGPEPARLTVPARPSQPGIGSVEVDATLTASANTDASVIRFVVGGRRATRTLQLADSLMVSTDTAGNVAEFWLVNVPPFPEEA